jgi:hypothetical protein
MLGNRWLHRGLGLAIVAGAVLASFVSGTVKTAQAATCPPPPSPLLPFVPWNDSHDYVLTTGGSFERGAPAWSLAGGAQLVAGNAPNKLDSSTNTSSLYLPPGSSATSPCVTAPQIAGIVRFFVKNAGLSSGQLKVEVLVKGSVYDAGLISANGSWSPSPMLASNAPYYKGAVAYQVRLTSVGSGAAFVVDDVYFDPFLSKS